MIKIILKRMTAEQLEAFRGKPFSDMVKFVVDVEKEIAAFGGELHADAEEKLLEHGCKQKDLWGGNYYFDKSGDEVFKYTSLINIRPSAKNNAMEVQDEKIRAKMRSVLGKLLP